MIHDTGHRYLPSLASLKARAVCMQETAYLYHSRNKTNSNLSVQTAIIHLHFVHRCTEHPHLPELAARQVNGKHTLENNNNLNLIIVVMADDSAGTPGVVNPVVFFDLVLGGAWKGFHPSTPLHLLLKPCLVRATAVPNPSTERV